MLNRSPVVLLIAVALFFAVLPSGMGAAPVRAHKHARAKAGAVSAKQAKASGKAAVRVKSKASLRGAGKHARGGQTAEHVEVRGGSRMSSHARTAALRRELKRQRRLGHGRAALRTVSIETNQSIKSQPIVTMPTPSFMPPPMRGSRESLVHQNVMAEADGLERILDDEDLADRVAHGSLVPVPVSNGMGVNPELPENRRYCRPWTAKFLSDLAAAHSARFQGSTMLVTSAVRTVEFQRHLRTYNGNAAAAEGDIASPHLTGGTIDLAKQGMTKAEIGWLRAYLIPLEQSGKIDVEEEFRQSCFHISVYKSYTEAKDGTKPGEKSPVASASMLAAHGR